MPETTVFDHYEVMRREDGSLFELGRGAMGITYKAFDTSLCCPVALKVINTASIHGDVARQRFVREARSAAQLRHRNVASIFHLGMQGETYFYAMEFIEGETVESLVRRSGPLKPILALRIAVQVARALNAAQKHELVHRDIKPSNLMLVREDEELVVKVIDFGLAKSSRPEDATAADVTLSSAGFVGTPHFASPEQLEESELDVRSDIYSLGVTLWFMLTGEAPYQGTLAQVMSQHLNASPPVERVGLLPDVLRDLLLRMLGKRPELRPQTPAELRLEMEECIKIVTAEEPVDSSSSVALTPNGGQTGGEILKNKGFYAGAIVSSRYELLRDLGESNSGWAFEAEDLQDGSRLRLLVLEAAWAGEAAALAQIEREVERLRAVEHPNIVRLLGLGRTSEAAYVMLEWTDGFSLLELLRSRQELDADETLLLLRQAAAGVDAAMERGLRHVDFSLSQVFIHFPGGEKEPERRLAIPVDRWPQFQVKINALGITREFATSDTWAGGQTIVGGVAGAGRIGGEEGEGGGPRHYIQSLAAVVYELLGGTLSPVVIGGLATQPASRYVPVAALPEAGNEVLKKALDPERSYGTAGEFCTAFAATLAASYHATAAAAIVPPALPPVRKPAAPTPPPPAARFAPAHAPVERGWRFPWLGLLAVFACAGAAAVLWHLYQPGTESAGAAESAAPAPELAAVTPPTSPVPAATPARPTPTPKPKPAPSATPIPTPTPNPQAVMNALLQQGSDYETAHDWPKAIETYLDFMRSYPGMDTGRVRLETLLSSLRPTFDAMPDDQFTTIRPAITDAARQEIVPAMMNLANHLRTASPADAFAWYCAAAVRGSAPAMTQAGVMESNGNGVAQNWPQAAAWFQWAANSGDTPGKTCLAECCLNGIGVAKDQRRAIALLEDASAGGDARAMNILGTCLDQGIGGPRNYDEAFKLFSQAHDMGSEDAAGNLGVLYMNGDGVARDPQKAVNLFDEGARHGDGYCMYQLAKCLEYGVGTAANPFEAEAWYRKAAAAGNPMAIRWCEENSPAAGPGSSPQASP
ncbi:MAG: protein kinase [Chthoniobacteraceae bacterium]|jgi:serine/threonine protein kinase/TPR repeat protein